jgi:hypothetical protein
VEQLLAISVRYRSVGTENATSLTCFCRKENNSVEYCKIYWSACRPTQHIAHSESPHRFPLDLAPMLLCTASHCIQTSGQRDWQILDKSRALRVLGPCEVRTFASFRAWSRPVMVTKAIWDNGL